MATFKTRARALDMLGRQQIAGRPTAISELFKNAHDAYADHVEVDYYRTDGLFVLRDDGIGMTLEDFEDRWLTLGTESKLGSPVGLQSPPRDPNKPARPILGEKGIGRLAIAAIGPQVLVLTRAERDGKLHDLVAAFINWGIFECPGINMDEVYVPVFTYPGGTLPTVNDVREMVDMVRENLHALRDKIPPSMFDRITHELDRFEVDPVEIDRYLAQPSLRGDGQGTHFIILPTDELLCEDIGGKEGEDEVSSLFTVLVGFTNTMTPGHRPPCIRAAFRDHKTDEIADDLIEEAMFFTPEEFQNADHHIQGRFDEFGQFRGTVTVYQKEPVDCVISWPEAKGHPTDCGPFTIDLAVVQGVAKESLLPPDEWVKAINKMNKLGGLYIYKDGIRILPYGRNDYDWLDIERNRTKSASYYYFSYRRMFGAVEISQADNADLSEKAGREGFRENRAYRQLQNILKNLFIQMAADFFRDSGTNAHEFIETKATLEREELARRKREVQTRVRRSEFQKALGTILDDIDNAKPEAEVEKLVEALQHDLLVATGTHDQQRASRLFIDAEARANRSLDGVRQRYRVAKPRGIGLSKQIQREWSAYQLEAFRLETQIFEPTSQRIEAIVGELARQAELVIDIRKRMERAIQEQIALAKKATANASRETQATVEDVSSRAIDLARTSVANVNAEVSIVLSDFARLDVTDLTEAELVERRSDLETRITSIVDREREILEGIREQISAVNLEPDEDGRLIGTQDTMAAIEEEVLVLREQADADIELAQLGMAISVINHEFGHTIRAIRQNLRRLKAWADVNEGLTDLYRGIRGDFDHLDEYLRLFTPLNRRLYRKPINIRGADIATFLRDLFRKRLEEHGIDLEATRNFQTRTVVGLPSTFYPVFVNLVDNALFWVKNAPEPRMITLDADNDAWIVRDTGSGILPRDREAIFELGFTRKPGGRGMGLHIARETLKREGYRLVLVPSELGAEFRIEPDQREEIVEGQ